MRVERPRVFKGWSIVATVLVFGVVETTVLNPLLSVFVVPLEEEFGWARTTISGAVTAAALGGMVLTPIVGPLLDRFGARLFLAVGGLIIGLGVVGLSLIQELWHFYLFFGIGRLAAMGVTSLAGQVAVSNWFVRLRGRALGVTMMGQRIGQSVVPVVAQALILGAGWRSTWLWLGLAGILLTVLPSFLIIRRRPEDFGMLPDGDAAKPAQPGVSREPAEVNWTLKEALRTRALWLVIGSTSMVFVVGGALNLHMVPYWQDRGLTAIEAVGALSLYSIVAAGSTLIWGVVADRIGVRTSLALCLAGLGVGTAFLMTTDSFGTAAIFAVGYGAAFGGAFPLTALVYANYFGRTSLGAIRGFATPFNWFGNAVGPLAAGVMFDSFGNYFLIFAIFTAMYLLGAVLAALAARPRLGSSAQASPIDNPAQLR